MLITVLRHLGFEAMIRDERVVRALRRGTLMIERLFCELFEDALVVDSERGQLLPRALSAQEFEQGSSHHARLVCDFLASMTEGQLTHLYGSIFETHGARPTR